MADLIVLVARMRYWCDVASLGYSQSDRWDIRDGGNADCSSLVIWCLREAGFDTGGATYTGNLSAELTARGWARLPDDGDPQPGDILLNDADHVAVYLGGGRLAQASMSEHGTAWGSGGDQTGGETNTSPYYDFPWDCYLRYTGPQTRSMGGYEDMPVKTDSIDWDGQNVSVEYALQDLKHKLDALGDAKHVSDMVWFGQGDGTIQQAPLYTLRAVQGAVEQIAQSNGLDLHDVQTAVAQGVKDGIQAIKTTVEVKR